MPLGRVFSFITRRYIGFLSNELKDSPIERYFYPLYLIGMHSGVINQQELACYLMSDKVSVVRVINSLEKEGLIERVKNPSDKRQHFLNITEKAKPWVDKIYTAIQKSDEAFISRLPKEIQSNFKHHLIDFIYEIKDLPTEEIEMYYSRKKVKK